MCTDLAISQCTVLAPGQHTLVSIAAQMEFEWVTVNI